MAPSWRDPIWGRTLVLDVWARVVAVAPRNRTWRAAALLDAAYAPFGRERTVVARHVAGRGPTTG